MINANAVPLLWLLAYAACYWLYYKNEGGF